MVFEPMGCYSFRVHSLSNTPVNPAQVNQYVRSARLARSQVPKWKRRLDLTLVLLASPIWLPLSGLIAILIKMVSPGPALFRQERIGHMGGRFPCLKFRTMKMGADTTVHREHLNQLMTSGRPMQKLDNSGDARLIPGGLWLRSLGLDELPQLINVLRGEMSLVGPRPATVYEYEKFQIPHRQRCATLPGLTGLWQVRGKNRTTFQKMMELDLQYVEQKSLLLDLRILAGTFAAILRQCWDVWMGRRTARAGVRQAPLAAKAGESLAAKNNQDPARTLALAEVHGAGSHALPRPVDG